MESQAQTGGSTVATPTRLAAEVAGWRPQRFGDGAARNVKDPIIEPLWVGTRAIVRVGFADRPEIADERGEPIVDVPAVVAQIETAALAASLVLDGYLTGQATRATEGVILWGPEAPSAGDMAAQLFLGSSGTGAPTDGADPTEGRGRGRGGNR